MAFKLGSSIGFSARAGDIKNRFTFNKDDASVPGTPVIRTQLEPGVLGEANMDGSIYINNEVIPGSHQETDTLLHEMRHVTDMKIGKLAYGDDYVSYRGITYPRETRNGKDMIKYEGKWKEAGDDFPWENEANRK